MSIFNHKRHNVSVIMYHIVCPVKYRRVIFDTEKIDNELREICLEISKRYEIDFIEIGADKDHVHFLIQSVPKYSPSRLAQLIKSITAKQLFKRCPEIKKALWGGEFCSKGYFISTVGQYGNEEVIKKYVSNQGKDIGYKKIHKVEQLSMFEEVNFEEE